jgi:hypothetical protein
MSQSELNNLVAFAQRSRYRGFVACRGEMHGQTGVIIYSFLDPASAAAFHKKRQIEAKPLRLEVLDSNPKEVREFHE